MSEPKVIDILDDAFPEEECEVGHIDMVMKTRRADPDCKLCRGTGREPVYGGPDRDCAQCGPRY